MDVSYPISITGVAPNDLEGKLYERSENADHGYYPVGRNHFWHGGVHFCGEDQLHAVADGLVVAYRLNDTNRPYEGPPYPPAGENPTYSNGFVLIKHEFATPKNVRIPFYSLYMHLKAMTEPETKEEWDTTKPPFIFKKTHYQVITDEDGGGLPIINAGGNESLGVIPYGSDFLVLPNDDKCKNERYFKVKKYTPFEGYILAAEDESTAVFSRAAVSSGRRAGASAFPLVDKDRKATGKTIKAHEFFTFEETKKGDFSRDYRYERVLYLSPTGAVTGCAKLPATVKTIVKAYRQNPATAAAITVVNPVNGEALATTIPASGYFKVLSAVAGDWFTKTGKKQKYQPVEYFPTTVTGWAMIKQSKGAAVSKNDDPSAIPILDDAQASLGSIPATQEYLVLGGKRPAANHFAEKVRYRKVGYPDPAGASQEGYAFVRKQFVTAQAYPALATGELFIWGSDAMTSNGDTSIIKDDRGTTDGKGFGQSTSTNGELDVFSVFEIRPDAEIPDDHWSRKSGWRKVSYTAAARQGQAGFTIDSGYAFLDTYATAGTAPAAATDPHPYSLMQESDVAALKTQKKLFHPPFSAIRSAGDGRLLEDTEKKLDDKSRPWDGRFSGLAVRATGAATGKVIAVLARGTVLKFKTDVAFKVSTDGLSYEPAAAGYQELHDGGFVYVSRGRVTKRCQILEPVQFNQIVVPSKPLPIRKGDIVGQTGAYLNVPNLVHFEIFAPNHEFTQNRDDYWGTTIVRVDPNTAKFHVREPVPLTMLTVPKHAAFTADERDLSERSKGVTPPTGAIYCHVKISLIVEGWLAEKDLTVPPPADPEAGPALPAVGSSYKLAGPVGNLWAGTAKGTVERTDEDGKKVKVEIQEPDTKGASRKIPGAKDEEVTVLEYVDAACKVRYTIKATGVADGDFGWITEANLTASTDKRELGADFLYVLKNDQAVSKENPAQAFKFTDGATLTGAKKQQFDAAVAALPRKPAADENDKLYIEVPGQDTKDFTQQKKAADGSVTPKAWLGLDHQKLWVGDGDFKKLSKEYAWLEWRCMKEQELRNKADTPELEDQFSKDGFCDLDYLMDALNVTKEGSAPRDVKMEEIKSIMQARDGFKLTLRRFACAHPTEWDENTDVNIKKWDRLTLAPHNFTEPNRDKMINHIKGMQFWDTVTGLPGAAEVWHFHPVGFLAHIKKLEWITKAKLSQIFGSTVAIDDAMISLLNDIFQTYKIDTPLRMAHFLAQTALESNYFQTTKEGGDLTYFKKTYAHKGAEMWVGNSPRFIGRGIIQLSTRTNYLRYETYIADDITSSDANAQKVERMPLSFDSAAWYWRFGKNFGRHPVDLNDVAAGGDSPGVVRDLCKLVNGGVNHLGERVMLFQRARAVLLS